MRAELCASMPNRLILTSHIIPEVRRPYRDVVWCKLEWSAHDVASFAISRRVAPEFCCEIFALSNERAQGMPGARCTRGLVCKLQKNAHTSIQVQRRHPAFPAQWFYGLYRALPGDRALLSPSLCANCSANLTPASRRQDHTTSPSASAPFVKSASASTASRPASVTIAKRPSSRDGIGELIALICPTG